MCKNCDVVNAVFDGAKSNPHRNLIPVHSLLHELIRAERLEVYAGDCPFENMPKVLSEEKHYTVCFYFKCPDCGEVYFLGACIRGTPVYKKIENLAEENIDNMIRGSEGTYFK